MATVLAVLFLLGYIPLVKAWWSHRHSALIHTLNWTLIAWTAWIWLYSKGLDSEDQTQTALRYLALSLTACAIVAVLGARRPGVSAWNFVVLGLLAVELLPLAQALLSGGTLHLEWFRIVLLGGVFAVGILNYLPTRLGPAAILFFLVLILEMMELAAPENTPFFSGSMLSLSRWGLAFLPWFGYGLLWRKYPPLSEFDRLWLDFRNSFGLVWSQRLRDQFNRSAHHAGWPVFLSWSGLRRTAASGGKNMPNEVEMLATLMALMKRFGGEEEAPAHTNPKR
jgi:hypothetical protein